MAHKKGWPLPSFLGIQQLQTKRLNLAGIAAVIIRFGHAIVHFLDALGVFLFNLIKINVFKRGIKIKISIVTHGMSSRMVGQCLILTPKPVLFPRWSMGTSKKTGMGGISRSHAPAW